MKRRAVSTSSTDKERDRLRKNIRLEKFVGRLRRPNFLSFQRVRARCRAQCGGGQALDTT